MSQPIRDVILQVIENLSSGKVDLYKKIQMLWEQIFSKEEKKHTNIGEFKDGNLMIEVDSSLYIFQMNLRKAKILEKFQQELPEIKTILFKIGKINEKRKRI